MRTTPAGTSLESRRRSRGRRGSTILEAALALSALLVTILVIFELSVVLLTYQGVAERARAGVRYAAVFPADVDGIRNVVVYGDPQGGSSGLFGLSTAQVSVETSELDNESAATAITVNLSTNTLVGALLFGGAQNLSIRLTAPVEGVYQ